MPMVAKKKLVGRQYIVSGLFLSYIGRGFYVAVIEGEEFCT